MAGIAVEILYPRYPAFGENMYGPSKESKHKEILQQLLENKDTQGYPIQPCDDKKANPNLEDL